MYKSSNSLKTYQLCPAAASKGSCKSTPLHLADNRPSAVTQNRQVDYSAGRVYQLAKKHTWGKRNWKTSSKSRFARKYRKLLRRKITAGANLATAKIIDKLTGKVFYVTRKNQGYIKGGHTYHSEKMLKMTIRKNFPSDRYRVVYLYTERSPCNRPGHNCEATSVPDVVGGKGKVYASFDYKNDTVDKNSFKKDSSDESDTESETDYTEYNEKDFSPYDGSFVKKKK